MTWGASMVVMEAANSFKPRLTEIGTGTCSKRHRHTHLGLTQTGTYHGYTSCSPNFSLDSAFLKNRGPVTGCDRMKRNRAIIWDSNEIKEMNNWRQTQERKTNKWARRKERENEERMQKVNRWRWGEGEQREGLHQHGQFPGSYLKHGYSDYWNKMRGTAHRASEFIAMEFTSSLLIVIRRKRSRSWLPFAPTSNSVAWKNNKYLLRKLAVVLCARVCVHVCMKDQRE